MKIKLMKRREFIRHTGYGLGAAWLASGSLARAAFMSQPLARKFTATDSVTLGNTGIKTSRLAMGTGTVGSAITRTKPRWESLACLLSC
jgi:hypothetical protein